MRVDGFASMAAGYDGGGITTRPYQCSGSDLRINAKADFGQITAEVRDDKRRMIPGFSEAESVAVQADRVDQALRWKTGQLASLRGRPVRLRFRLRNARLYSYRLV